MGEGPGFWRHWRRGAWAFWRSGTVLFMIPLAVAFLGGLAFKGYEWVAGHFHLPLLEPNGWLIVAAIAAGTVLFAPAALSNYNDNKTIFPAWRAGPPASPPRPVAIEVADGFSFLDGVLCEQVRPELGGRWVLLGTYGNAILVPRYPYKVTISGLLNVETTKAFLDPLPARIRLDEQVISLTKLVTDGEVKSWTIELIPRVVDVTGPATFHIDVSIDGETWTEVMRKPVYAPDEDGGD
jgi:hypothetical protein